MIIKIPMIDASDGHDPDEVNTILAEAQIPFRIVNVGDGKCVIGKVDSDYHVIVDRSGDPRNIFKGDAPEEDGMAIGPVDPTIEVAIDKDGIPIGIFKGGEQL